MPTNSAAEAADSGIGPRRAGGTGAGSLGGVGRDRLRGAADAAHRHQRSASIARVSIPRVVSSTLRLAL